MKNFSPMTRVISGLLCAAFLLAVPVSEASARPAPESFADLVEKLMPAVVNISTTQKIKGGQMFPGMPQDPQTQQQFREFFERMLPPGAAPPMGGEPMEQEAQSLGSGFIIDPAGYVVTNNHVIADATEIHVILSNDKKLDAEIVGRDPKTDIALLKVKTDKPLPSVKLGNSADSRVGDWVIAIGNPFGLGGTVTAGIISARARNINAGPFDDFIQTDAAINRGNSGGPLFNAQGEVIGINTAIFSPSGGSIGIGFAVPTALVNPVLTQLKEHGRTFRGWLGVKIQVVTDDIAESLGMKDAKGALVVEVTDKSPAQKAGIKVGDIILRFNGQEIGEMRHLPRMVAETSIGAKAEMVVLRDGKEQNFSVKLGELEEEETAVVNTETTEKLSQQDVETYTVQGMGLAEMSDTLREQFALGKDVKGLVIVALERSSEAAKRGLNFGDVVMQVGDTKTTDLKTFKGAMKEAQGSGRKFALLRVWRKDATLFITLPSEEKQAEKAADKPVTGKETLPEGKAPAAE